MSDYKVSVDLSALLGVNSAIAEAVFPAVAEAVSFVAEQGAYQWKQSVNKSRLWSGEKQPYVESISWKKTGPFAAEISSDYKLAEEIEKGRPAKDLKRMLQTSKKVRMTKDGRRYLIIPFRHNVSSESGEGAHAPQMPPHIYAQAKSLSASRVLTPGSVKPAVRLSASGHAVAQHSYAWGGKLPGGLSPKLNPNHHSDPHAGMVRFDTSTPGHHGKKATKSSSYLTFRVMVEGSPKWIVPAKPGLFIVKGVADGLQSILDDAVGQAVTLKSLRL